MRVQAPVSVTLDASGNGYATVTVPNGVQWYLDSWSVSTNATIPYGTTQPLVTIYQDSAPNMSKFIEDTSSGNRDTSNTTLRLQGGESICAQWSGGTPGALATFIVRGEVRQVF